MRTPPSLFKKKNPTLDCSTLSSSVVLLGSSLSPAPSVTHAGGASRKIGLVHRDLFTPQRFCRHSHLAHSLCSSIGEVSIW
ncbi:hypothetical protein QN277_014469 [Acacia crassicarpa]|uniref:Uncharacterized protein n=1 Tax=Acacia crassicarpa TaxID=499986 RepID=A0AAE1IL23_9FABA|nr:hypothetical protein QN277_014469 [Acacia crassicarpa]